MIKSTELRIGNWINSGFGICEVRGTGNESVWVKDYPMAAQWYDAIPITEDWLIRFGFKEDDNSVQNYYTKELEKEDSLNIEIRTSDILVWLEECETDSAGHKIAGYRYSLKPELKYVHQLQNLFFALTGNELNLSNDTRY